jgi:hypothetical protein
MLYHKGGTLTQPHYIATEGMGKAMAYTLAAIEAHRRLWKCYIARSARSH